MPFYRLLHRLIRVRILQLTRIGTQFELVKDGNKSNGFHNAIIFLQIELEGLNNSDKEIIQIKNLAEEKESQETEDLDAKNDDNDDGESGSCCSDANTETPKVIEINVTIGNMDTNPLFNTLLNDNDNQDEENNTVQNMGKKNCQHNDDDDETNVCSKILNSTERSSEGKTRARENGADCSESEPQNKSPFMTEISTKRRKVL